jgi:hypothetical protein
VDEAVLRLIDDRFKANDCLRSDSGVHAAPALVGFWRRTGRPNAESAAAV